MIEQCKLCRYSKQSEGRLLCKKREVQVCLRAGAEKVLVMSRDYEKVNLMEDCDRFRGRRSDRITGWMRKFRL